MNALEAERNVCGGQGENSRFMPCACGRGVVCNGRPSRHVEGITLVEVLISLMLAAVAALTIYSGTTLAVRHSQHTAHRVAAFGRCRQLLEEMRGAPYAQVTDAYFPQQLVKLTHLGGMGRIPIEATITNTIVEEADPARKRVAITAEWQYMGRALEETIAGYVFDRESRASSIGAVSGSLILNPVSDLPEEFTLWWPDGSTLTRTDLESGDALYSGSASRVEFSAGGSGVQTTLHQNFQPFPVANVGRWALSTSDNMTVSLSHNVSSGQWKMKVDGTGVVLSRY